MIYLYSSNISKIKKIKIKECAFSDYLEYIKVMDFLHSIEFHPFDVIFVFILLCIGFFTLISLFQLNYLSAVFI